MNRRRDEDAEALRRAIQESLQPPQQKTFATSNFIYTYSECEKPPEHAHELMGCVHDFLYAHFEHKGFPKDACKSYLATTHTLHVFGFDFG